MVRHGGCGGWRLHERRLVGSVDADADDGVQLSRR
ncbi:hypothetical protein XaFJ1_GM001010 [Xanthomonas albilineans]|nr:hypothetical protein XaFJ1_GM001010 [Xanthomonas albilineans]